MSDRVLRVGLIGVGNYSRSYHVPHLMRRPDARVAAACDVPARAAEVAALTGADRYFADYRELVDSGEADAVIVSTPHALHYEGASYALARGLPTMVDKPLTIKSEHARDLLRLARENGALFMTALNRRFDPASLYARRAVQSGALGEVQLAVSMQRGFATGRSNYTWLVDPEIGGGMLYGRTCHMADLLPWLCGSPVVEVDARVRYDENGLDVRSLVGLTLENGVAAQMVSLVHTERNEDAVTVYGAKQSVRIDRPVGKSSWQASLSTPAHVWERVPEADLPEGSTSTDNFVDSVLGLAEPQATGIDGARSVRVIEAAIESARGGAPVRV